MSEKEIQSIIDKTIEASKKQQGSILIRKIFIGVTITVLSTAIITFFSSFFGVKRGVKNVTTEFVEFKDDTEKELIEIDKEFTEVNEELGKQSDRDFNHEGRISKLEGLSERGGKRKEEKINSVPEG